jgi:hypothetical protein
MNECSKEKAKSLQQLDGAALRGLARREVAAET